MPLSRASRLSQIAHAIRTETIEAFKTETKTRIEALRDALPEDDKSLLVLRINRQLEWTEIAHVMLYEGEPLSELMLKREAARLRKRFQLVKERLRKMARQEGLIEGESG